MKPKKSVLIVEEQDELRRELSRLFEEHQYEAHEAGDIEFLWRKTELAGFDLILIHWRPEWYPDRFRVRAVCGKYPESVVIVAGLLPDYELAVDFLKAGARDCLGDTLSSTELVDACEAALNQHFRALRPWYNQSVMAIAAAIGLRDVETEEHCQRVSNTTVRLCRALGLDQEKHLQAIRWGAFLHDVGKVGIPDSILHKSGSLDPFERQQMRRHPEIGRDLLARIPFLEESIPLVLFHHERFDGSGYPQGLRGEEIPLEARAIAVADTVDAMLSNRVYRSAQTWETVLQELQDHRGSQFDPWVVDVALGHRETVFQDYISGSLVNLEASV